jgi:DNA-binding MarR family transcriptional regulator
MPKGRVAKTKMFRDFSYIKDKWIKENYLKNWSIVMSDMLSRYDLSDKEMRFMLFVYDLEFFTMDWIAGEYKYEKRNIGRRLVYPLLKKGYVYKHFDKLTPSTSREDHLFRDESKYNYRVRYALSQNGRLVVSKFYRKMAGEEPISVKK